MSWAESTGYPHLPIAAFIRAVNKLGIEHEIGADGLIECCGRLYYPYQEWVTAGEVELLCRVCTHPQTLEKLTLDHFYAAASSKPTVLDTDDDGI